MHREGRAAAELPCWKARSRTNWSKSAALLWRPGSFCLFFPPPASPSKIHAGLQRTNERVQAHGVQISPKLIVAAISCTNFTRLCPAPLAANATTDSLFMLSAPV